MAQLLLIDGDQVSTLKQVRQAFPAPSHRVDIAGTGTAGLEHLRVRRPDVILLALHLPDQSGLEVYGKIRQMGVRNPVIFITMARTADMAIEAMKRGAYDYLFKPLDPDQLRKVGDEALEVARRMQAPDVVAEPQPDPDATDAILGQSPAMCEVYKAIGRVAAQDVPVLITGESGTGKELVARAIYQHGARVDSPFLALNCAAIPETLLESELFGHEKGAFTGAERRRIGKFEQCDGGTLFLDEVGDMPPAVQAKVLRLLQEQAFERVGGNETVRTSVRLIAATHRDLRALSLEGKFRPDLYYRLGVFAIHLPPLRERGDDLPMLVRHYLRRYSQELGREVRDVAPEAMERLRGHAWPGNIRELQNVLKQALLRASGRVLLPSFLPDALGEPVGLVQSSAPEEDLGLMSFIRSRLGPDTCDLYAETHRRADRLLLTQALEHADGSQHRAARLLGIARQTLRLKLRELGLHVARSVEAASPEARWDDAPESWPVVGSDSHQASPDVAARRPWSGALADPEILARG
jgi:two-component system nitrogen regulation response regulator GlnG